MTSTSSHVTVNAKEKHDIWLANKCVFCKSLLDGDSILLKCLHVICKNCVKKEQKDTGVKCKCLVITGKLVNYPIVSPGGRQFRFCSENTCSKIANTKCACCKSCSKKYVDVYCIKCSIMVCSLCQLKNHQKHKYEVLEKLKDDIITVFKQDVEELGKNNNFLDWCLEQSDKQLQNMNTKKLLIYEEIDKQMEILHEKLNKRKLELLSFVNCCFLDQKLKVDENKKILYDFHKKSSYYIELTNSILKHDNKCDFVNLFGIVKDKLNTAKSFSVNIPRKLYELDNDFIFNYNESLNKCITAINAFGDITMEPITSLSTINLVLTSENMSKASEIGLLSTNSMNPFVYNEESDFSCSDSDTDVERSDSSPFVMCSCCNQWAKELICCSGCNRYYHNECHIPIISVERSAIDSWKCTLCEDITVYTNILNQKNFTEDIVIGNTEMKIIERILMQLYCQNDDSEHFRDCLPIETYPTYYEKISNPMSLNTIKRRLISNNPYKLMIDVINDLKLIFSNAVTYYSPDDPYFESVFNLQNSFKEMLKQWLPKFA